MRLSSTLPTIFTCCLFVIALPRSTSYSFKKASLLFAFCRFLLLSRLRYANSQSNGYHYTGNTTDDLHIEK
jgi:hypothetical protein